MDEAELILWRIARLEAAVDKLDDGNTSAFGRRMGYKDGAFIRQMLNGHRAITEKIVRKVEAQQGMVAWFDPDESAATPLLNQIRGELAVRDVPEHVLTTFLSIVRGFPHKQKAA